MAHAHHSELTEAIRSGEIRLGHRIGAHQKPKVNNNKLKARRKTANRSRRKNR